MLIIITNKYKEIIANSVFKKTSYKCASGYLNSNMFVSNLKSFEIDNLVIDVTAIREVEAVETWETFKELIDPNKIFVLLDASKQYSNPDFFATLVKAGIYNFSKKPDELSDMIENPKTYEEVEIYVQRSTKEKEKREVAKEKYEVLEKNHDEHQKEMQEYIKMSQREGFNEKEQPKYFDRQLIIGGIHLPLMTICLTVLFFTITSVFLETVSYESFIGQFLYAEIMGTSLNMIVLIELMVVYVFVLIYFVVLDEKIKRMHVSRGKFIIIPFAMLFTIIFTDYYVFGILSSLLTIESEILSFVDYGAFAAIVVGIIIFGYYLKMYIASTKKVEFDKALADRKTILEIIMIVIMIITMILPVVNKLFDTFLSDASITNTINSIAGNSALNMTLIVGAIISTGLIVSSAVLKKEFVEKKKD